MSTNASNVAMNASTSAGSVSELQIFSSIEAAKAAAAPGLILLEVSKKANVAQKRERRELFLQVPFEILSTPEVPETFRFIVEDALSSQAVALVNKWADSFSSIVPSVFPLAFLSRQILVDSLKESASTWMDKEELEASFADFDCWKAIVSSPNYKNSDAYRKAASAFKDAVLKLSAKNVSVDKKTLQVILARMSDNDVSSLAGQFIAERCTKLIAALDEKDAALDALALV